MVASGQDRVQVAEAAPLAQMFFRVARPQDAWILNGEFERHGGTSEQEAVSSKQQEWRVSQVRRSTKSHETKESVSGDSGDFVDRSFKREKARNQSRTRPLAQPGRL